MVWSYSKATDPATGELARVNAWQILSDNSHQPLSCKGAVVKKALLTLRNYWQGLQIYLRGGVRLLRPVADVDPSLNESDAIRVLFQTYLTARRPNLTTSYVGDDTTDVDEDPEQEGPAPPHSVAHPTTMAVALVNFTEHLYIRDKLLITRL